MSFFRALLVCSALALPPAVYFAPPVFAHAQEKEAPKKEDPKERKRAKVRDLLEGMNQLETAKKAMSAALEGTGAPKEFADRFLEHFDFDEMIDETIEIYCKHLEEEEIDALVAFYKSDAGKKLAEAMPEITIESFKVGQELGKRAAEEISGGK
ncbi:MAG: DUF2059 domain-containing protein [Planctomycetes bacterium]|nr:DUF2059 domain-containing protein [Planctomycetota bacterium]